MRIAILGTRGIPARYGGFETFAEELSTRMVQAGHQVVVYGRRGFFEKLAAAPSHYRGVEVRITPTLRQKYLETPLHALTSFLDILRRKVDVIILCNAANSPCAWLAKLKGTPLLINVDGIERLRGKWNALGRWWYRLGEFCSVLFATRVIADAHVIANYYRTHFHIEPAVVSYGAEPALTEAGPILKQFNLRPQQYLLYVSRLEPENNARGVIEAYNRLKTYKPLVIVGDAPYAREYIAALRAAAGENVIFTGYQFGDAYKELRSNCYLYVQATEVGGAHPALIEAMAYGNCVVANATPEHLEVLGGAGVYYWRNDFEHLRQQLQQLIDNPARVRDYGTAARQRAQKLFTWDVVVQKYLSLCEGC